MESVKRSRTLALDAPSSVRRVDADVDARPRAPAIPSLCLFMNIEMDPAAVKPELETDEVVVPVETRALPPASGVLTEKLAPAEVDPVLEEEDWKSLTLLAPLCASA
jgi:hypothetical protein